MTSEIGAGGNGGRGGNGGMGGDGGGGAGGSSIGILAFSSSITQAGNTFDLSGVVPGGAPNGLAGRSATVFYP
jgi:hypothetical protein